MVVDDRPRGVEDRGTAPSWATAPPVWGEPVRRDLRTMFEDLSRPKVGQFARPDGSTYETTYVGPSGRAWADTLGHRYLGPKPVPIPPDDTPRGTGDRGLTPPPLLAVPPRKPPPPPPGPVPPPGDGKPRPRPGPVPPPPALDDYGFLDYLREDALHTTMTESTELLATWFVRIGKALQAIPGMQGIGKGYEAAGKFFEAVKLVYELIHEVKQAEALEKGSKQVIKRTKPVKRIAERLLKKKYPLLPDPIRKKAAEILEDLFEKYVSDPAIKKGVDEARELDEDKQLEKTLWDDLRKLLIGPPALTPAP